MKVWGSLYNEHSAIRSLREQLREDARLTFLRGM